MLLKRSSARCKAICINKYALLLGCLLGWWPLANAQWTDTLLNRHRTFLFHTLADTMALPCARSLNAQHQWPDINYHDIQPSRWKVAGHLEKVRAMACAWANPASPYYHRKELWNAIGPGLDHWLEKRYRSANWWHNEIGVPQYMRDIIVLLRNDLPPRQLQGAMEVLAQHRVKGVGANLIWSADLGLYYGALSGDTALMLDCSRRIGREIKISEGEGMQPDLSFHQHNARLQMYQYGAAFLQVSTRLAWELRGTPWSLEEAGTALLADLVLEGWQWMARGINTVPGTLDRSVSRPNALHSADIRSYLPYLGELFPARAAAFQALGERQSGKGRPLTGFRYYPRSDFAVYHSPAFSFFVKTISTRTLPTESINNENLKGRLLNSGNAYLVRDGEEYFNLMPVWDWQRLPGTTAFEGAGKANRQAFTGSAGNDSTGFSVMDLRLENGAGQQSLAAHKIWACHGNRVVCLIAGIQASDNPGDIYTALDQCRWRTPVTVSDAGGRHSLKAGLHSLRQVQWLHHAGFAYILLAPSAVSVKLDTVTGSWASINASVVQPLVTDKVFLPLLQHPAGQTATGYVLAPCAGPEEAAALAARPDWRVLRNDTACQALSFSDGAVMAAFFAPALLETGPGKRLEAERPCLMLISRGKLYVSDPAQQGGVLKGSWNGRPFTVEMPANGTTVEVTSYSS